jgi:hypothetical protein
MASTAKRRSWRNNDLCHGCGGRKDDGCSRCSECRSKERTRGRLGGRDYVKSRRQLRIQVLRHYSVGGRAACACCGETTLEFLQIDHINNDGAEHRRSIGRHSGDGFYKWLRANDFPPGFQVLCCNCNFAKGRYGECPHERMRREAIGA